MDRLTKVTENGKVKLINFSDEVEEKYPDFSERLELMFEKLSYYEDLEEQDRFIKLPCKVGDTVYQLNIKTMNVVPLRVIEYNSKIAGNRIVEGIHCSDKFLSKYPSATVSYYPEDFGNKVFLTKSEAEARLQEVKKINKEQVKDLAEKNATYIYDKAMKQYGEFTDEYIRHFYNKLAELKSGINKGIDIDDIERD